MSELCDECGELGDDYDECGCTPTCTVRYCKDCEDEYEDE